MKINDIIVERINSWQDMEQEIIQDISTRSGQRHPKYMNVNTQKAAQDAFANMSRGMDQAEAIHKALSTQVPSRGRAAPAEPTPAPAPAPQQPTNGERKRKDRLGRRLQHDRYYRPSDTTTNKPTSTDTEFVADPDSILPEPIQKGVHKVKKTASKAKRDFNVGRDFSKKLINFDR